MADLVAVVGVAAVPTATSVSLAEVALVVTAEVVAASTVLKGAALAATTTDLLRVVLATAAAVTAAVVVVVVVAAATLAAATATLVVPEASRPGGKNPTRCSGRSIPPIRWRPIVATLHATKPLPHH